MKDKKKVTKQQRKKRRLRAIKQEYGVGDLYFEPPLAMFGRNKHIIQCSKRNLYKEHYRSISSLVDTLEKAKSGQYTVLYMDDKMAFDNLDELREHLLIKRLARI